MSMPAASARSRAGLVVFVLVLDLGLASAGGVMLAKGLAKPSPAEATPPPAPKKAETVAPPAAVPAPPPTDPPAPPPIVASGSAIAAALEGSGSAAPAPEPKTIPKKKPPPPMPLDPYETAEHALKDEIDLQMTRDKPSFDKCSQAAGAVHGYVHVAFQVHTDGHVVHVSANDNTTGSSQLANCLTTTIVHWSFAIHPSQTADFMRPFTYP